MAAECTAPARRRRNGRRDRDRHGPRRRVAVDDVRWRSCATRCVIMGRKKPPHVCEQRDAAFHVAERTFGRFARGVRLSGAFDAGARRGDAARRRAARHPAAHRGAARPRTPHPRADRLTCGSCSSATSSASPDARSRGAPFPRSSSSATIDFVIANVENSAAGFGVTGDIADTILSYGVDVMTSGNHVWDKKEVLDYIPRQPKLLRPGELPRRRARPRQLRRPHPHRRAGRRHQPDGPDLHGAARRSVRRRAARDRARCARRRASSSSTSTPKRRPRRSRWAGTSTAASRRSSARTPTCRPPTNASCPKGTACLTDVGMTGPHDSIIGVTVEAALARFVNGMPAQVRIGDRPRPAERRHRHRRSRERQGHRDRAPEPVGAGGRRARRHAGAAAVIACRICFRCPSKRTRRRSTAGAARSGASFTVSELTAAIRDAARDRLRRHLGRRRDLQLPAVEHRARCTSRSRTAARRSRP